MALIKWTVNDLITALLLLVGLNIRIRQSICGQIIDGRRSNEISLAKLNEELTEKNFHDPADVGRLLLRSADKSKIDRVIGKLSVDEILELNQLDLKHCTESIGNDRRWTCNKMSKNPNLALYCEHVHSKYREFCETNLEGILKRALNSMGAHKKRAKKFAENVDGRIKVSSRSQSDVFEAVHEVFMRNDGPARLKIRDSCKEVGKQMANVHFFKGSINEKLQHGKDLQRWIKIDSYCGIAFNLLK